MKLLECSPTQTVLKVFSYVSQEPNQTPVGEVVADGATPELQVLHSAAWSSRQLASSLLAADGSPSGQARLALSTCPGSLLQACFSKALVYSHLPPAIHHASHTSLLITWFSLPTIMNANFCWKSSIDFIIMPNERHKANTPPQLKSTTGAKPQGKKTMQRASRCW